MVLRTRILLPTHTAWNFPKSLSIFSKIVGIEYFSSPNSDIFVHNRFKDVYFFLKTFNLPNHFFISKKFLRQSVKNREWLCYFNDNGKEKWLTLQIRLVSCLLPLNFCPQTFGFETIFNF